MEVRAEYSRKWSLELGAPGSDTEGQDYSVWVVTDLFCAARSFDDLRYPKEDGEEAESKRIVEKKVKCAAYGLRTVPRG